MYLLIIIFFKSEFMAAQRARPILLNERFLVIYAIECARIRTRIRGRACTCYFLVVFAFDFRVAGYGQFAVLPATVARRLLCLERQPSSTVTSCRAAKRKSTCCTETVPSGRTCLRWLKTTDPTQSSPLPTQKDVSV